ncbi:GntR family transcriptional regulator [Paenibacillus sp. FSL K6-1096]|uniref:GntR family transcriptional regulator n=1 Tax=Paenibacillus sp. FSL K6-1096 TaxID=2921460 RepID=UPI0030EF370D
MEMNSRRLSKDNTYSILKQKIIDSELEPDQAVNEEGLAALLGVSRTPLREAIQRLEQEDFLIRQPNGRLRVAPLSLTEVEEVFQIRSMLEGHIARSAARNATPGDIQRLTQILDRLKYSFQTGERQDFVSYGFEFHDYLSDISGLKTFGKVLGQLRDRSLRYCRYVSLHGDWNTQADEEHLKILRRIAAGDEDGAEQAMREHILTSLATALEQIRHIGQA